MLVPQRIVVCQWRRLMKAKRYAAMHQRASPVVRLWFAEQVEHGKPYGVADTRNLNGFHDEEDEAAWLQVDRLGAEHAVVGHHEDEMGEHGIELVCEDEGVTAKEYEWDSDGV